MRNLKTSTSQRRQQSTDTNQLEMQTPFKRKLASVTQNNFFSPNSGFSTIYSQSNKGFGGQATLNYKQTTNYSASTNQNHSQDQILCDTILLNSQQKRSAIQHLQGGSYSAKQQTGASHKLNFLGSTNKNQYVDIKTKRINDLNTIYTEGSNTDFNSQNVFMNKLVYHINGGAASQQTNNYPPPSKNSMPNVTGSNNNENKFQSQNKNSYHSSQISGGLNSRSSNRESIRLPPTQYTQQTESQFNGLEDFVKTMYKSGSKGFYKSQSTFNANSNISKTQYSMANSKRDYDDVWNSTTSFIEDQEQTGVKINKFKTKDLFITKISNTFITPKYLYFQNQPKNEKFQKRNSLLDNRAHNPQTSISQSIDNQINYASPFANKLQASSSKQVSQEYENQKQTNHTKYENLIEKKNSTDSQFQFEEGENDNKYEYVDSERSANNQQDGKKNKANKYILSMQSSMMTEFVLPESSNLDICYLFIFINNLNQVKRKNNLKYTFLQIPKVQNLMSETKLNKDYSLLKEQIKTRLQINSKDIYLFLDDGTPIKNHMDIVRSDNKERRPIFAGGCGGFCGIHNLYIRDGMKSNLIKVINGLIEQNINHYEKNSLKNEENIQPLNNTIKVMKNTQSQQIISSTQRLKTRQNSSKQLSVQVRSDEFQTKEQFAKKQNKEIVDRAVNILTHNPNAKIKRFEQEQDNPRIRQLQKIEDLYDQQLRSFKKQALEVEASASLGDNPEKQQTKNLRQIADYIDEFLEKNFPQQNQPLKTAIDQYSSLVNNMQQKTNLKRNFIQENIQKELFVKNIPKVLSKYELSRHDLHSIYILYKALLTVSIQRIDWKDVAKGGIDFKTFEHGIDKISSQSEEIIRRMCNYENFINWNQFIDILYAVSGKTLESKIDIFIKVADTDRGGSLSKEEISELCYICLDKILPKEGEDDSMVQGLVEYFTRLLFTSLDVDPEDDIPLHKLKNAIVHGHPENDLLCFFCGVEYTK